MIFYYLDLLNIDNVLDTGMFIRDIKHFINLKKLSQYDGQSGVVLIEERWWKNNEEEVRKIISNFFKHKNLIFMLCDTSEGYPTRYLYYSFFEFLEENKINKNRIFLLYNNSLRLGVTEYDDFYTLYYPSFLYEFSHLKKIDFENYIKESLYDFSCFNRNIKTFKDEFVLKVLDARLNCAITYDWFGKTDYTNDIFLKFEDDNGRDYLKDKEYFLGKINLCTESEYYSTYHHKATAAAEHQWDDMIHISEKTFRNISYGIPFVLIGSKYSLNELKRIGFKTFDSLIDESYDEADDSIRMDMAIESAKELLKYHNSPKLNEILKFNQDKIREFASNTDFFNSTIINPLSIHLKSLDN